MKGAILNIRILTYLALFCGLVMAVVNFAPSWSQYALTWGDPLLHLTLGSVFGAFLLRSTTHPRGNEWNIWYRNRQWNRITAYMFLGIACTPVTSGVWYVETLHFVFTAFGIISGYVSMIGYQTNKVGMGLSVIGCVIGVGGFLTGFLTNLYSVGVGELIASLPLAMWVLNTNENQ